MQEERQTQNVGSIDSAAILEDVSERISCALDVLREVEAALTGCESHVRLNCPRSDRNKVEYLLQRVAAAKTAEAIQGLQDIVKSIDDKLASQD